MSPRRIFMRGRHAFDADAAGRGCLPTVIETALPKIQPNAAGYAVPFSWGALH